MVEEAQKLFEQRLGRYQAAMALETSDRVPIAPQSNYFADAYAGFSKQEILYTGDKSMQSSLAFARDFPAVDALRSNRVWAPLYDAVGYKLFKLPGRDLEPTIEYQFVEDEYMKADEYRALIDDPNGFLMERYLPRVLGELGERGSNRSYVAFVKGAYAAGMQAAIMQQKAAALETQCGMPTSAMSKTLAPLDLLADGFRGLKGIIMDMYRQPDNLLEACDKMVEQVVAYGLCNADPLKRYPIFLPTHKACFLTPKQFDKFYWPSFKKTLLAMIEAGYKVRVLLEGKWEPHWHHLLELPRASLLCDIDNENDIFKAKAELGQHHCIAGGMPDSTLILGTPEDVRQRIKLLCETVAKDGGFILNGGAGIPYDTKAENFRALTEAILEYGWYDRGVSPKLKMLGEGEAAQWIMPAITPWATKQAELGEIKGDEDLLRKPWETLESMAYNWLWMWAQC